jgi:shikimate 5-dehydrogenase
MGELEGKVAIVTGGGRGIGRAIAEAYLAESASVVVTAARESAEIEGLASRTRERALALTADVTEPDEYERVVSETVERFGGLDVLLPGGATETGMIPTGVPEAARFQLLRPDIVAGPAVYLASGRSEHLNGHRLVATEWSPEDPDGRPASDGIGV